MQKPIYANKEHQIIIENYTTLIKEFSRDVANETKWQSFLDVYDIIIEYHNNYGKNTHSGNWYDWLMILPINLSVMTNGFFAGIETKRNAAKVRSYKILLNEMLQDLITKIEKLEPVNE
tara:strand:+ start:51 stop:407 length:357 start_codon:yes stop_codon:yes gene_type:complete